MEMVGGGSEAADRKDKRGKKKKKSDESEAMKKLEQVGRRAKRPWCLSGTISR